MDYLLLSNRVDLVNLRRATPLLAFCAAREGRVLYEREPGAFASFVRERLMSPIRREMILPKLERINTNFLASSP